MGPVDALAVTFDFGQTLAELDTAMLQRRLSERGISCDEARLEAHVPAAWSAYDAAIRSGFGGHPWKHLMRTLLDLACAGVNSDDLSKVADWLWSEQPRANLWRRPIPGMIDLVRELRNNAVQVGVISNSEGRLAELAAELDWHQDFDCIADSGRLGLEKPAPEIFDWTARALGVETASIVHIGDSWQADVLGATGAGARAIWFGGARAAPEPATPRRSSAEPAVFMTRSAAEVREALAQLGLLSPI